MKGYKLFRIKNGDLYPLYVDANEVVPVGVWLDAKEGELAKDGKHVKSKLGALAYRPGWHLNDVAPYVEHIGKRGEDGKLHRREDTVWAEVEYSDNINYQLEANAAGTKNGKFIPRDAYLKRVPVDGYYRYKTNPKMYGDWIIAGKIKVKRILSESEVEHICRANGIWAQTFLDNVK